MIIKGRNIYPQDIELFIEENVETIRLQGCAAFSVIEENDERLVIVAEVKREKIRHFEAAKVSSHIRRLVSQEFQITTSKIVFIKPGTLLKTSSGKIQRRRCKQRFLEHNLEEISQTLSENIPQEQREQSDAVEQLQAKLKELLPTCPENIECNTPLSAYGIDSIGAVTLQVFLKEQLNVSIGFEEILDNETIESLVARISHPAASIIDDEEQETPQKIALGQHPLSYQQLGIWTELHLQESHFGYNLAKAIEILFPH